MKKPVCRVKQAKYQMHLIKMGMLKRDATGYHATPGLLKRERLFNKEDFALSPFYFSTINPRSLHQTGSRFHRKGWTGALGMDWLKSVR
jgi:hypothetical protein